MLVCFDKRHPGEMSQFTRATNIPLISVPRGSPSLKNLRARIDVWFNKKPLYVTWGRNIDSGTDTIPHGRQPGVSSISLNEKISSSGTRDPDS
jgi:hypothetical protein